MPPPLYAGTGERIWYYGYRTFCCLVLLFLILPIIIVVPLSFNAEPYFSFSEGMLALDPNAYSLRWYWDILQNGMVDPKRDFGWAFLSDSWNNGAWIHSMRNSFFIAICSTLLAATLGTLAALGLSRSNLPYRNLIMSILISPMIVPHHHHLRRPVLLLFECRPEPNLHRHHSGARDPGRAVRCHHRDRHADRLRPEPGARCLQLRSAAPDGVLPDHHAAHSAWRDFGARCLRSSPPSTKWWR